MKALREKLRESIQSVLPISVIVLLLSVSIAPISAGVLTLFLFGMILLIFGMGLFTLGSDMSMQPLGESIGSGMSRFHKLTLPLIICFVLGALVTVAEPDLTVLSEQIPSIPNAVLIFSVAAGVGVFLMLALLRIVFHWKLSTMLLILYPVLILLALFVPADFIPAAFDAGGVTTGPITVPFIMAFGQGLAQLRHGDRDDDEGFGLIALSSIGPILSVLILSILYHPTASSSDSALIHVETTREAFLVFLNAAPLHAKEVATALFPLVIVFLLFQLISRSFHRGQIGRILIGMFYTYTGLTLFLTGAYVGFMPAGRLLGSAIASGSNAWLLVPVGFIIGYFVVSAEPAVVVLKKQAEEISSGAISQHAIGLGLAIGVGISLAVSMLRILLKIPILPILAIGYAVSLLISFLVPPLYTAVAFDSGGVASGPMTTTFILPLAVGACTALDGNLLTDAFGVVAMVAITPLITIQVLGLYSNVRRRIRRRKLAEKISGYEDSVLYYDKEEVTPDA